MMTKDQYIESLRKLKLNLYMFGEKVENPVDNPVIRPSLNSFAATYELAEDPQYVIVVLGEDGVSGGATCAPVFKGICDGLAGL